MDVYEFYNIDKRNQCLSLTLYSSDELWDKEFDTMIRTVTELIEK